MIASSSSAIQEEVPKSDAIEETSATGRGSLSSFHIRFWCIYFVAFLLSLLLIKGVTPCLSY